MDESEQVFADERPEKLPPETALVRNRAQPRRLRKNVIIGLIAVLCGVIMLAFVFGILRNPIRPAEEQYKAPAVADETNVPGFVKTGPKSYGDVAEVPALGPAMQGDLAAAGLAAPVDSPMELSDKPKELSEEERLLAQEWRQVLDSPIEVPVSIDFKKLESRDADNGRNAINPNGADSASASLAKLTPAIAGALSGRGVGAGSSEIAGHQGKKLEFLKKSPNSGDNFYVKSEVQSPRSPYEVKSGAVIPCTLITGINSDLPGSITCHVRQNVFDTVTGNFLMVPQGTKVIGEYDAQVVFGQRRVLVIWHRLIMPNGGSLDLEGMAGVDMSGYSGYADRVNNHWGRLATAVVLSSVFSVAPVVAAGDDDDFNRSTQNELARNLGAKTKDAGEQIIERELTGQPTITIRPGLAINIFVKKDLILAPYEAHSTHEIILGATADDY
ncbi:MAG: TrbI/VirB10 family protein [Pseudomonadales bacterium]